MVNVGAGELAVILLVALVVLGPERLPAAVRHVGRAIGEVRRFSSQFESELQGALHSPVPSHVGSDDASDLRGRDRTDPEGARAGDRTPAAGVPGAAGGAADVTRATA